MFTNLFELFFSTRNFDTANTKLFFEEAKKKNFFNRKFEEKVFHLLRRKSFKRRRKSFKRRRKSFKRRRKSFKRRKRFSCPKKKKFQEEKVFHVLRRKRFKGRRKVLYRRKRSVLPAVGAGEGGR